MTASWRRLVGSDMKNIEKSQRCGLVLSVCGFVLMLFGIYRGEMAVVLKKAVNICLECIGIG